MDTNAGRMAHEAGASTATGVLAERKGHGLWLTLSRPDKLNALTPEMVRALDAHLRAAEADIDVRAVVITGVGRAFCAGADIAHSDGDPEVQRRAIFAFTEQVGALTLAIERLGKPVVAAVNGIALAGGLEIALACDLVFAAASAMIGDGHTRYGLLPGGGSTVRLPRKLPPAKARWLLFSGELVSATDPLVADLLTEVIPEDGFMARVEERVAMIARRSPVAVRQMKLLANAALDQSVEAGLRSERLANTAHFYSADRREGLAAFRERREPNFKGM